MIYYQTHLNPPWSMRANIPLALILFWEASDHATRIAPGAVALTSIFLSAAEKLG